MAAINPGIIAPEMIILPRNELASKNACSGAIFISGAKLVFYTGAAWETITSA